MNSVSIPPPPVLKESFSTFQRASSKEPPQEQGLTTVMREDQSNKTLYLIQQKIIQQKGAKRENKINNPTTVAYLEENTPELNTALDHVVKKIHPRKSDLDPEFKQAIIDLGKTVVHLAKHAFFTVWRFFTSKT